MRLTVARNMYLMRFAGEDVSKLSLQQLRGREGARGGQGPGNVHGAAAGVRL